jgi:hypothetical protein
VQLIDYGRLVMHPDATPVAVPQIETIEEQAKAEIEEALGREGEEQQERRP